MSHPFSTSVLDIDAPAEIERIVASIRRQVRSDLRKRGAVVAVSGGVDSAVCLLLCVRAFGPDHVLALALPEHDSSPSSLTLARSLATSLGAPFVVDDITEILRAAGCYRRQHEAVRSVIPEFSDGWKHKVVLPSILEGSRLNLARIVVEAPDGTTRSERLPIDAYLALIAAVNFKQRSRKMMEYYHADKLNFAVCGTPNRLEYDQGFFVKQGDGAADFKPIAHLFKTQVYALAEALGVPEEIRKRPPTTDTFPLAQSQEEFYFSLPYAAMDLCLFALDHDIPAADVAPAVHLSSEQVGRVYDDIRAKRRATAALHLPPILSGDVPSVHTSLAHLNVPEGH